MYGNGCVCVYALHSNKKCLKIKMLTYEFTIITTEMDLPVPLACVDQFHIYWLRWNFWHKTVEMDGLNTCFDELYMFHKHKTILVPLYIAYTYIFSHGAELCAMLYRITNKFNLSKKENVSWTEWIVFTLYFGDTYTSFHFVYACFLMDEIKWRACKCVGSNRCVPENSS